MLAPGWLQSPISDLNEALTPARNNFRPFFGCWQSRFSEVSQYTTVRLFTAMTVRRDWSRDMTLKHHSSSQDCVNHTAQCIRALLQRGGHQTFQGSIHNGFHQVDYVSRNSREKHFSDRATIFQLFQHIGCMKQITNILNKDLYDNIQKICKSSLFNICDDK